jgi:hypothetical protein
VSEKDVAIEKESHCAAAAALKLRNALARNMSEVSTTGVCFIVSAFFSLLCGTI